MPDNAPQDVVAPDLSQKRNRASSGLGQQNILGLDLINRRVAAAASSGSSAFQILALNLKRKD